MEKDFEDMGSLVQTLHSVFADAASFYQTSVAARENSEGHWNKCLRMKLGEARVMLEKIPNGDLLDVLNMFLEGRNWDDTSDVVKRFLYGYLANRFEELNSRRLEGVKY